MSDSPLTPAPRGGELAVRVSEHRLARRLDRLPAPVSPLFASYRDDMRARAERYVEEHGRPAPRAWRDYVSGFLDVVDDPLAAAQAGTIVAAYRWPMNPRWNLRTAGLGSAGTALWGETLAYGSFLTAAAGAVTVAAVGQALDLYAVASARTAAYRWAGVDPGPAVIADDLVALFGPTVDVGPSVPSKLGTDAIVKLVRLAKVGIVEDLVVPVVGAARGGYRTNRAARLAHRQPLTPVDPEEPAPGDAPAGDAAAPARTFLDLLGRTRQRPQG